MKLQINIHIQVLFGHKFLFLLSKYIGMVFVGLMLSIHHLCSKVVLPAWIFMIMRIILALHPQQYLVLLVVFVCFNFIHANKYLEVSLNGFLICIFLKINTFKFNFLWLFVIHSSYLLSVYSNIGFFCYPIVELWKCFMFPRYKSFVRYVTGKYFLKIYGLSFHSLNITFHREKSVLFWWSPISQFLLWWIIPLVSYLIMLTNSRSQRFYPMFSSRGFSVLNVIFIYSPYLVIFIW